MAAHNHEHSDSLETYGNFDLVKRIKLSFTDVTVSKWRSRLTGLSVVHLDYEAPIVNGYFVVATEIFDDSGCPHTLEHLVFLGSDAYPYKGIIDHLANRGFSNGTNAWTDTDHTAYTITTAGDQGFLQILPIYVDHILYPTLTRAGYITEVHHVDGKGQDSGVVYSEMQGRQNTSGDLMALQAQRLANPKSSAYRSETGGLMEALRVLSVDQIREYHSTYYVPHNLSLIVAGKFLSGTPSLLKTVQEQVEPNIVAHGQSHGPSPPGWKRPFLETASAIREPPKETVKETVEFPERDESVGELIIGFMGPAPNQYLERKALTILSAYLTSSAVAPLNKEYIETDSPLCTYIYFSENVRATRIDVPIYIGSIPTEHIDSFDEKLKTSLQRIVDQGIDMERMSMVLNRDERQLRSHLESAKGNTFSSTIIVDCLYGPADGSELQASMDEINYYDEMRKWSSEQWTDLLRKYYVDPPSIVIRGRPSAAMAEKLEKDEEARIAAQVEKLGPEGLKHAEQELSKAMAENERPIPTEILTNFPVPDVKSISWISCQSVQEPGTGRAPPAASNGQSKLAEHLAMDGEKLPFFVQYDHVQSDFVTIHGLFALDKLPNHLRPYLMPYISSFFSLPVKRRSGERLTHEEVVNKLDTETVSYDAALGISDQFSEVLRISLKVEVVLYETAVAWLRDLICGSEFDKERLQVTVAKIAQSLPEMKRDGSTVLGALGADLLFNESSTSRAGGLLTQTDFIPKLSKQLQDTPREAIAAFEEIRKHVLDPSGIRFSVTGNILDIEHPRSTWAKHFKDILPTSKLDPVPLTAGSLSPVGKEPVKKAIALSLATIESSFVNYTTKSIRGWDHPDWPLLRVTQEVLNATEGYLWRFTRGLGLAYGAYVASDLEAGLMTFSLYRSSNSTRAYQETANVIKKLADGTMAIETTTLDAAKSSIVYGVAKNVSTPGRAAIVSFTNQALKGVPQDFQVKLLEKYQAVTVDDVIATLQKYFLPLFDPSKTVALVVTAPSKIDQIIEDLTAAGFEVSKRTLEIDPQDLEDDGDSESEESSEEK